MFWEIDNFSLTFEDEGNDEIGLELFTVLLLTFLIGIMGAITFFWFVIIYNTLFNISVINSGLRVNDFKYFSGEIFLKNVFLITIFLTIFNISSTWTGLKSSVGQ